MAECKELHDFPSLVQLAKSTFSCQLGHYEFTLDGNVYRFEPKLSGKHTACWLEIYSADLSHLEFFKGLRAQRRSISIPTRICPTPPRSNLGTCDFSTGFRPDLGRWFVPGFLGECRPKENRG